MTITPRFQLQQDDQHVHVAIKLPYVRVVGATQMTVDGCDFHFYCKPYLLKLSFPHELMDDVEDEDVEEAPSLPLTSCDDDETTRENKLVQECDDDWNVIQDSENASKTNKAEQKQKQREERQKAVQHPPTGSHPQPKRHTTATYDPNDDHGTLTVRLTKATYGQHFEDLDFITKLMTPSKNNNNNKQKNQMMTNSMEKAAYEQKITIVDEDEHESTHEDNDKQATEQAYTATTPSNHSNISQNLHSLSLPTYGFRNAHRGVFLDLREELQQAGMVELPTPDTTPADSRRDMRLQVESYKFDENRYMQDLCLGKEEEYGGVEEDVVYQMAMQMQPHWDNEWHTRVQQLRQKDGKKQGGNCHVEEEVTSSFAELSVTDQNQRMHHQKFNESTTASTSSTLYHNKPPSSPSSSSFFTSQEQEELTSLSSKSTTTNTYPPPPQDHNDTPTLLMGLFDLLLAYAYDQRLTQNDPTTESAWTLSTLSPTLSWFESYHPPRDGVLDVAVYTLRRMLIYPYLRSYDFATHVVLRDACCILSCGRRMVLRCLLQIRRILAFTEMHYLLNRLYLDGYCQWVQLELKEEELEGFVERVWKEVWGVEDWWGSTGDCSSSGSSGSGGSRCRVTKELLDLDLCRIEREFHGDMEEDGESHEESEDEDSDEDSEEEDRDVTTSSSDEDETDCNSSCSSRGSESASKDDLTSNVTSGTADALQQHEHRPQPATPLIAEVAIE